MREGKSSEPNLQNLGSTSSFSRVYLFYTRGRVHVSLEKSRRQSIQDSQDNQVLGGLGDPVLGGWGGKIHVIEI